MQPCLTTEKSSEPRVLQQSDDSEESSAPAGGFRLVSTTLIAAVWFAFRRGLLSLQAVRAYFAMHEIAARRYGFCCSERLAGRKPKVTPRFRPEELVKLLGLPPSKAKRALAE